MSFVAIEDICRRVLGMGIDVEIQQQGAHHWYIQVYHAKQQDPLTRSQQEMDVIISLQHLLGGAAISLRINEG